MDIQENISNWILGLRSWRSELAHILLTKGTLEDSDISSVISMIKDKTPFTEKSFPIISSPITSDRLILKSIGGISNIEQLSPHNPLEFAESGLTVVYGSNGTGKSGYTRILKKITGKDAETLKGNIYKDDTSDGKCVVSYSKNDTETSKEWMKLQNLLSRKNISIALTQN